MSQQSNIIDSIKRAARVRGLRVGDKLPSVRNFSKTLGYGHVAVADAYKSLEKDGYVNANGKQGTIIIKDMVEQMSNSTYRILGLLDIEGHHAISVPSLGLFKDGLKHVLNKVEMNQILFDSRNDGLDELKDVIYYHYKLRDHKDNIFFLLQECPKWIKSFFQEHNIPCIVNGGVESGIELPYVCGNVKESLKKILEVIYKSKSTPVALLLGHTPIGTVNDSMQELQELGTMNKELLSDIPIVRLANTDDIVSSQIDQLFECRNRPQTLIVDDDETGYKIAKICRSKNILIPDDVKIICLDTGVNENIEPSISGIYYDRSLYGWHVGEIVSDMSQGKDCRNKGVEVSPSFVFRDSFPE